MSVHDEQVLLTWLPRLRRYARALTSQREDADDLVQETLERAWTKASHWSQITDMRAWLFSIMHNLYIDRVRRPGVTTVEWQEGEDASVATPSTSRLELFDLQDALRHLSAEQREVVLLIGLEGMTYAEVAQTLGIPTGTVMSRLARGRERLRSLMEGSTPPVRMKVVK
ncbi:RNA polymerase sigma factor [Acidovorax sp. MR-S7]|uniref:RNA polymerase sigma factor n=1 Tax=Acidovorax sp. MR-S7 TaxID=1268622 RepID=UPI0003755DFB|nr:RNA polymerase sigma factor [Acidovorax sp. MR-S7]GAD24588.1 DNA-directed RNA polymerase specialized sigma subunit, sigma24 homolog [Acidovorax sp. MR-S7]